MNKQMVRIGVFTLGIFLISVSSFAQQRALFSQYIFDGLILNPAYAGSHVQMSTTMIHRDQWVNIDGAPKTQMFSTHVGLYDNKVGVGFIAAKDQIGVHDELSMFASYAYKIQVAGGGILSFGVQAGIQHKLSDFTKLDLFDPSDPNFTPVLKTSPNFGTGVYFQHKSLFAGLSVPYLLTNQFLDNIEGAISEVREKRNFYLTAGTLLPLNTRGSIKLRPSTLIRLQGGAPTNFDFTTEFIFDDVVSVGLSYRNVEGFVTFVNLKIVDSLHLGYGYDWTLSDLNLFSNGSHEFMLNYRFRIRGIHKPIECPTYYSIK